MILYSMAIVCQLYRKYIKFRVGQLQYMHKPQSVVYKINQFVMRT